jgi:enamine deaminase RidA (YjgF/YER057c/UK114 family)
VTRNNVSSGGPWEDLYGYSRAVRVGQTVAVAGTTAAEPDGSVSGGDDAYLQAKRSFEIAVRALEAVGASRVDVVRVRMFVTDISRSVEFARAMAEFFRDVRPAATMVQVAALIDPRMLIEVEVDAVIDAES